jgi:hypothetical protein
LAEKNLTRTSGTPRTPSANIYLFVTIIDQALWLLCSLGATVFAAASAGGLGWVFMVLGFVAASTLPVIAADASMAGGVAAVIATALLATRTPAATVPARVVVSAAAVCAGVLAAWSGALLHANGVPHVGALALGVAWPMISASLVATNRDFAPRAIRDEALLLVLGAGLGVAMVPRVVDGWRSAVVLNVQPPADGALVPAWTLMVVGAALGVGGVSALFPRWRSR